MGYNIGIVSLGCAKNQTDAEIMLGLLAGEGHKIVADPVYHNSYYSINNYLFHFLFL